MAKRLEVNWTGMDTLQNELQALPKTLIEEGNAILVAAAQDAKAAISAAYPIRTGNLRRGLVLRPARGRVFAGATLRQRAPHGSIYESGTKPRYNKAGMFRGLMPATPTFWPIATTYQNTALAALIARLYAHGAASVTAA
jgi:hypothetical protein